MISLTYHYGTLEIRGLPPDSEILPAACQWDSRVACHRAPAMAYAQVFAALHRAKLPYEDHARAYEELDLSLRVHREARPFQTAAIEKWKAHRARGVVVLPTGAGKTHVAVLAIADKRRSTLVVAPTLDLVRQWYDILRMTFGLPVGIIGGGDHDVQPLTVTTYDSAYLHMEHIGARFGLVIFDECHHLPGESYALAARLCLAPWRLGLTATPERTDGSEERLWDLIGPLVYRQDIGQMTGEYLSDYEVVTLVVELSDAERREYNEERAVYRGFVEQQGIRMSAGDGWTEFVKRSARSKDGLRAMAAYRRQRELALQAPAKLDVVRNLLHQHRRDRTILFTQDNATAYEVSRRFLVPVITHQTKVRERSEILTGFSAGRYTAISTSKVLNEGVDVPEANVAVVMSGSGSPLEHVQRLGRILRKKDGKRAVLYELISGDTGETFTSQRRREHSAYR